MCVLVRRFGGSSRISDEMCDRRIQIHVTVIATADIDSRLAALPERRRAFVSSRRRTFVASNS
jgi:hypothetical protein